MTKAIGRLREFSVDEILDKAIVYFRRFGYHSASISRLEEHTDITAGSIYKAFKNKQHFYQLAFDRYVQNRHIDLQKRLIVCENARDKL